MFKEWWGQDKCPNLLHARSILERAGGLENQILEGKGPLDRAVALHQKSLDGRMGSSDRAVLGLAVYGFARNREVIRRALPEAAAGEGRLLALSLLDSIANPPMERFQEFQFPLARLSDLRAEALAVLEKHLADPLDEAPAEAVNAFTLYFSLPGYLLAEGPWRTLGEAALELDAGKFPQKPQVRVDLRRGDREGVLASLASRGVKTAKTAYSPWGLVLEGRLGPAGFSGLPVEFQDEGSQIGALACLPLKKGAKVLDLCAGSGGKALALAGAADCRLFLHDVDERRLSRALPRFGKGRDTNVALLPDPARMAPYDVVLVDAPCSSTGTLRRNPDIPWRWDEDKLHEFAALQTRLLQEAASLVAEGGLLVYLTCSLLDLENNRVIEDFLKDGRFSPEAPPLEPFHEIPESQNGYFRLPLDLTGYHGDGFFCARLRRV